MVICLPSLSHQMHTIASADKATMNSWPEVYLPESDDAAPDDDAALPASMCSTSSSSSEATALIHLESTNACLMMSFCTEKLHDEVMRILLVRVPSIAHCQYTEYDKSSIRRQWRTMGRRCSAPKTEAFSERFTTSFICRAGAGMHTHPPKPLLKAHCSNAQVQAAVAQGSLLQ